MQQFIKSKQLNNLNNLVVLHGLCGSPSNFSAIVKNNKINNQVNSHLLYWHSQKFNMPTQTNYLNQYIQSIPEGGSVCLMGHSIGAKIIMSTLAQYQNELRSKVKGAIIIDMLPFSSKGIDEVGIIHTFLHLIYLKRGIGAMKSYLEKLYGIELKEKSQEEILKCVSSITPNKRVADLLLQNIDMEKKSWKIDIEEIIQNYNEFIYHKIDGVWPGRVLVLAGENSNFVSRTQIHTYKEVFSSINLEKDVKIIEKAGHWVQADQPIAFINEVSNFLKDINA